MIGFSWIDSIVNWIGKHLWKMIVSMVNGLVWLFGFLIIGLFGNLHFPEKHLYGEVSLIRKILSWIVFLSIVIFLRINFNDSINNSSDTFKLVINIITFGAVPLSLIIEFLRAFLLYKSRQKELGTYVSTTIDQYCNDAGEE